MHEVNHQCMQYFMYISEAMCALWSTTQCDLQLYIWFPWQQKKIRESFFFHVFLPHVVTGCLYVFMPESVSI